MLRLEHACYLGSDDVDIGRYTSQAWHDQEVVHVWGKVWQYACRTHEIPEVGDYYVYEIVRGSYIEMRTEDGIKAYVNACLHRGRRLKDYDPTRTISPGTGVKNNFLFGRNEAGGQRQVVFQR